VPKSRVRRKSVYTPEQHAAPKESALAMRWVPILMVFFLVLGLAWIVLYYIAGQQWDWLASIGNWNLVIGFALLGVGFAFATRWR
jgi:hypothetical protein